MARLFVRLVAASLLLVAAASAVPLVERDVPVTPHIARLTRRSPSPDTDAASAHRFRNARRAGTDRRLASPIGTAKALPVSIPAEYLAEVKAGGYRYALQIDTGSSDTWFVKDGFQCLVSHCNLGPMFRGDFPGGQIEEHFNISYGGDIGAFLNGQMGYSE